MYLQLRIIYKVVNSNKRARHRVKPLTTGESKHQGIARDIANSPGDTKFLLKNFKVMKNEVGLKMCTEAKFEVGGNLGHTTEKGGANMFKFHTITTGP